MLHRNVLVAALVASPLAAQSEMPDFPTAATPPTGDAFPEQVVEFPDMVVGIADVIHDTQVGYRRHLPSGRRERATPAGPLHP